MICMAHIPTFISPEFLKLLKPKTELHEKKMYPKRLFRLTNGISHRESLNKHCTFDILVTMNDNLTKYHDTNEFCILSLLGSKPKCTFNDDKTCDCFNCIQRWMNSNEER